MSIHRLLYNTGIYFYGRGIHLASLVNKKARLWSLGRKQQIITAVEKKTGQKVFWFHCASLGEFEQGRPLIEKIKQNHPGHEIILTFFSPSGYEIRRNYPLADAVYYLPEDLPSNARNFIETIQPDAAFFVKYEFWFNYLQALYTKNIPAFLISGRFHKNQIFFKPWGKSFIPYLRVFQYFFLLDENSQKLLADLGFTNAHVSGDTRFDRVWQNAQSVKENNIISAFKGDDLLLVCGSTWPTEERILSETIDSLPENLKIIIAPHEVDASHIRQIIEKFGNCSVTYSSLSNDRHALDKKILIIDNIGLLSSIYQYADIAIIGGGFRNSLHNMLEPAAFGMPIFLGPQIDKNPEAKEAVKLGFAHIFRNSDELTKALLFLISHPEERLKQSKECKAWVERNTGSVTDIYCKLDHLGLL